MKSPKLQAPNPKEPPSSKPQGGFAAFVNRCQGARSYAQGAFKKGARTASSPRLVSSKASYGEEPPLLAHFLERTLGYGRQSHLEIEVWDFFGVWGLEFGTF
jgi:hypothetical protein